MIPKYRAFFEGKIYQVGNLSWLPNGRTWASLVYENDCDHVQDLEEIELMQWTGLVDLNGVDVFEGDIINTPHADWHGCHIWKVEFDGCEFSGRSIKDPCWRRVLSSTDIEVIGNIHLNPELLEGAERE